MPAHCVAVNCNNSQTTPGITTHELPCSRPTVRQKWIKFIQFKRADFLAALHHAYLCSEHFSECDFANCMEYRMGFASKLTQCSSTLSKSCLTGWNWYGCILVGLLGISVSYQYQFRLMSWSWPFYSNSPEWRSRHMVTWFGRHGDAFGMTENAFFCAFITLRSQFHLHHRSQKALTEIVSKITPNLGLVLYGLMLIVLWHVLFICRVPDVTIATDIICGFPTETEKVILAFVSINVLPVLYCVSLFWCCFFTLPVVFCCCSFSLCLSQIVLSLSVKNKGQEMEYLLS